MKYREVEVGRRIGNRYEIKSGVDGLIGANGSYVKDGDEVILWNHLSAEDCRHIVDWLHKRGLEFYLEANSGLYGSEKFETAAEPSIKEYVGRKGRDSSHTTVRDVFPEMIFGAELYRDCLCDALASSC